MSDHKTFVIVGGGLAGAKAAETLREEGFGGRVALVAAMHVNDRDAVAPIRELVETRAPVDARRPCDPDRPVAHDGQPA